MSAARILFFKRLGTYFAVLIAMSVVLFNVGVGAGSGIASARAQSSRARNLTFTETYKIGYEAAQDFRQRHGKKIWIGAALVSAVASFPLTAFFPWCRKKKQPPPIPRP